MAKRFPYVKLHDLFPLHRKVSGLSDAAFRAYVTAICYAHALETDGFYPAAEVKRHPRRVVGELVDGGLWLAAPSGFVVHDYPQWNETRAEIEARANAKSIAGAMGAATRWGDGTTHDRGVNANANASGSARSGSSRAKPRDKVPQAEFDEFWAVYPRRDDKIDARKAFKAARSRASLAEILEGAARYYADPNRTPEYTKLPATWLNAGAWENGPLPARNGSGTTVDSWLAEQEARRG